MERQVESIVTSPAYVWVSWLMATLSALALSYASGVVFTCSITECTSLKKGAQMLLIDIYNWCIQLWNDLVAPIRIPATLVIMISLFFGMSYVINAKLSSALKAEKRKKKSV